jgi:arsenate reductase
LNLNFNILKENDFKKLLLTHYSFLKRPVLLFNNKIYIGNSQKTVEEAEIELCKN